MIRKSLIFRTSLFIAMVSTILLITAGYVFLNSERTIIDMIKNRNSLNSAQLLEDREKAERSAMIAGIRFNAQMLGNIAGGFIFDFDNEGLMPVLESFLPIQGMIALEVVDKEGKSFAAAWKDDGKKIRTAQRLPEKISNDTPSSFESKSLYENEIAGRVKVYFTDQVIREKIDRIQQKVTADSAVLDQTIDDMLISASIRQGIGIFFIIVLQIIFITLLLVKSVTRPIKRVVSGLRNVARDESDLTTRIVVDSQDELGELSGCFNIFVIKLQEIISDISLSAENLNNSSFDLTDLSGQMRNGITSVSSRSDTVASLASEMSSSMTPVTGAMGEACNNISMISTAAEDLASTIDKIAMSSEDACTITEDAVIHTKNVLEKVVKLGSIAKEIGKISDIISDISTQTNLLALNATIEAARAGEAGKGFAVVANEVKELANQTASATSQIDSQIEDIQRSTNETIQEISIISKVINKVSQIVITIESDVREQMTATKEIASNVSQASGGISDVNDKVAQSSIAALDIAKDISEVNKSTSQMSDSSASVNLSAKQLADTASQLKEMVEKFII